MYLCVSYDSQNNFKLIPAVGFCLQEGETFDLIEAENL
jgi:hypothetical protein